MQLHIKAILKDFPFRYLILKNTDKNIIIKYILRFIFFFFKNNINTKNKAISVHLAYNLF